MNRTQPSKTARYCHFQEKHLLLEIGIYFPEAVQSGSSCKLQICGLIHDTIVKERYFYLINSRLNQQSKDYFPVIKQGKDSL